MVLNYVLVVLLLALSALFSGLTLGLMSLSPFDLKRKMKVGDTNARKIYPLRVQGNLLLTTLLVGNVAVNSILAVFLGSLTTGIVASILATILIVIFGEIIPQSVFSRFALEFGAKCIWVVKVFQFILYPVTKPLALALDHFLGKELPESYSKKELKLLVEEQKDLKNSDLKAHEYAIVHGGLVISEKRVKDVMTPKKNVYMLNVDDILTRSRLVDIQKRGHSRMPVYSKKSKKMIGMLYAKDLVSVDPAQNLRVKSVMHREHHAINSYDRLDRVLNLFKKRRVHLFIVENNDSKCVGIITLEDVLEEIVGEIVDEHDKVVDMRVME